MSRCEPFGTFAGLAGLWVRSEIRDFFVVFAFNRITLRSLGIDASCRFLACSSTFGGPCL